MAIPIGAREVGGGVCWFWFCLSVDGSQKRPDAHTRGSLETGRPRQLGFIGGMLGSWGWAHVARNIVKEG